LQEHHDILYSKLNPLGDELNVLSERLQTMDIQKKVSGCHQKLEQWRLDCHRKIEHLFEQKSQELDQLLLSKEKNNKKKLSNYIQNYLNFTMINK